MTVSGIVGWYNIRRLDVRLSLSDEIYDGLQTLATLSLVNNKSRFPSFLIRVSAAGAETVFNVISGGKSETSMLNVVFNGRGEKKIGRVVISSPFPINFFIRKTIVELQDSFTVFPRPIKCQRIAGSGKEGRNSLTDTRFRGYEGDIEKIGDYTGNEPLKMIHWRLSAKHSNVKVKELASSSAEPVIIDIDSLPGVSLEERLSCGADMVNRLIRANRPAGLKQGETVIRPDTTRSHRLRLLGELARYGKN